VPFFRKAPVKYLVKIVTSQKGRLKSSFKA
jgi:hypothetical protein